ncbi:MAG TPA: GNAT family N-acetyltransferase, partial [Chloroflexota bacterium]|nr:GNAT family N-acetyltransferase [Chloroflexota bacterium]
DLRFQGQGLGSALLKDALLRAARAADEIGVRAVLVHARDTNARVFYEKYDFEASPVDGLQLCLLMKDLLHEVASALGQLQEAESALKNLLT